MKLQENARQFIHYTVLKVPEFQKNTGEFYIKSSDLFDNAVYIPEVCDVINIALAELPALLSLQDVSSTLLHVKHGPDIICWTVANFPDCFYDGKNERSYPFRPNLTDSFI